MLKIKLKKMKERRKLLALLKAGITKNFISNSLCISRPTLNKRLIDGKFTDLQKKKINNYSL